MDYAQFYHDLRFLGLTVKQACWAVVALGKLEAMYVVADDILKSELGG